MRRECFEGARLLQGAVARKQVNRSTGDAECRCSLCVLHEHGFVIKAWLFQNEEVNEGMNF